MQRIVHVVLLLIVLGGSGCSSTADVVGRGPLQKRKYRPGWNLELAWHPERSTRPANDAAHQRSVPDRMNALAIVPEVRASDVPPLEASLPKGLDPVGQHQRRIHALPGAQVARTEQLVVPSPQAQVMDAAPVADEASGEPRRWNRMALVSGIFLVLAVTVTAISGGTALAGYLLIFTFLTGVIGLILAIKHRERGKGIAIAAIAMPLAILLLAVAALNSSW